MKNSRLARRYDEEFKRQGVELLLHSGKTQRQVARELDVSDYSLTLWKELTWASRSRPSPEEYESRYQPEKEPLFRKKKLRDSSL